MMSFVYPAMKKAFAEDKDIQKVLDEDFIILNLVVSFKFRKRY